MSDETITTPPHDLPAEQAVLGAMLMSREARGDISEILQPSDFYRPAHSSIFEAVMRLDGQGEPADALTVAADLLRRGHLDRVGGPEYLHTLIAAVPTAANGGYYARIVAEKAVFRRLLEAGGRIAQIGQTAAGAATDAQELADQTLHAALNGPDTGNGPVLLGADSAAFLDELEALQRGDVTPAGVLTGFSDLDEVTRGFQPGQLVIIAARPSVGKTTLALDVARAAAIKARRPTLFVSLEMTDKELRQKIRAAEARISLRNIQTGQLTEDDWSRLTRVLADTVDAPLRIDTSPGLGVAAIRTRARRMQRRHGLDLLIVDYLQLLVTAKKEENRQQEVAGISRSLKLLAGELGVPVVALSQLNRAVEQRAVKRPQLSDLRDSGAIEQDADMVIMIHREDAHDENSARAGEADLIIEKNRSGPKGTFTVAFQGHYSRFVDMGC
ncbi:Replicative DNA helicase [Frankia canadensis]|uniref:Replicative DNA helicase n=1 Tax=Frankia canadensis TaxID=1836972 RepID=A0A2I2KN21_9ACTN|nr:replicative DNA helicase [Frankia canadensis]SNQ47056.1 Replicative DNA helicase [Frankia canadensis]SOU54346.1 Replicative DNA helicase [Frankia canadensis]